MSGHKSLTPHKTLNNGLQGRAKSIALNSSCGGGILKPAGRLAVFPRNSYNE